MRRCAWVNPKNPLYVAYHDREWGVPLHDDRALFELLLLETFQAGLSWECILNKREAFRRAFDGFDAERTAAYGEDKIAELLANPGIIRNRLKIRSAVNNARSFMEIQREYGSFDAFLWSFTRNEILIEPWSLRTTSPLSDEIARELKKRKMSFVGSTVIYSLLQSAGVINAHGPECGLCPGRKEK